MQGPLPLEKRGPLSLGSGVHSPWAAPGPLPLEKRGPLPWAALGPLPLGSAGSPPPGEAGSPPLGSAGPPPTGEAGPPPPGQRQVRLAFPLLSELGKPWSGPGPWADGVTSGAEASRDLSSRGCRQRPPATESRLHPGARTLHSLQWSPRWTLCLLHRGASLPRLPSSAGRLPGPCTSLSLSRLPFPTLLLGVSFRFPPSLLCFLSQS